MFFGGYGGFPPGGGGTFEAVYRAMPVAFIDKQSAEYGDKVIMPPSALERLASLHIEYPMLFKLEGIQSGRHTHCGVLEFVAEEGVVYLPHWMMQNLLLQVGDTVRMRSTSLKKGTYVKLQPVTSDFLDISNPKAVLERTLRSYSCLTVGDCFVVNYNNKNYEIEVREAKPASAISVIETDCQVDFEAPKDYKEPEPVRPVKQEASSAVGPSGSSATAAGTSGANGAGGASPDAGGAAGAAAEEPAPEEPKFFAFAGTARRLDGKASTSPSAPVPVQLGRPGSAALASSSGSGAGGSGSGAALSSSPATASATQKAGTFIGFGGGPTGNRLADKLNREKAGASKPPTPPPPAEEKKEEEEPKFKAFGGKGYSLKG